MTAAPAPVNPVDAPRRVPDLPTPEYVEYKAARRSAGLGTLPHIGRAVEAGTITTLDDLPFPIVFRNRGALDEWRHLFNASRWGQFEWRAWTETEATCLDCIHEIYWQYERQMGPCPLHQDPIERAHSMLASAIQWGANIHYERQRGTLIHTTEALDFLLTHADLDDSLPLGLLSLPFPAQYLKLERTTAEQFTTPEDKASQCWVDGVFCFICTTPTPGKADGIESAIEFVVVYNNNEEEVGTHMLRGPLMSKEQTLAEWVDAILIAQNGARAPQDDALVRLLNYVVKVFLYLGLKDARKEVGNEYSNAVQRLAALGPKKQAKVRRRLDALYDRITVGPASLAKSAETDSGTLHIAPHWRRGHFRLQPCGPSRSNRKLIFVSPILVRADRLDEECRDQRRMP